MATFYPIHGEAVTLSPSGPLTALSIANLLGEFPLYRTLGDFVYAFGQSKQWAEGQVRPLLVLYKDELAESEHTHPFRGLGPRPFC